MLILGCFDHCCCDEIDKTVVQSHCEIAGPTEMDVLPTADGDANGDVGSGVGSGVLWGGLQVRVRAEAQACMHILV